MPVIKRHKTKYAGVYYIIGTSSATGKAEKIFYVRYRKDGKQIDEKVGRQIEDDMTAARANVIRAERIAGHQLSNKERRKEKKAEQWTFNKLWENYKVNNQLGPGSLEVDECNYKKHIQLFIGDKEPKELAPFDIDRLKKKKLKELKPATIARILTIVTKLSNYGVDKGLCEGINFKIKMPKINNEKTEDLSPDQLTRLLEAINESDDIQAANIMKMALFTGMRRGELFKLQWDDVDFERRFIHIRNPKGGKDQKIPLNDEARELLKNHPVLSEYVFPRRDGGRRTDIAKQVNRIKEKAGLPKDFRPLHGLRHVYASMLASSGKVDIYILQKLLTHKDPKMTQRYAHLRDDALRKASDLAGDIINDAINSRKVVNLDDRR